MIECPNPTLLQIVCILPVNQFSISMSIRKVIILFVLFTFLACSKDGNSPTSTSPVKVSLEHYNGTNLTHFKYFKNDNLVRDLEFSYEEGVIDSVIGLFSKNIQGALVINSNASGMPVSMDDPDLGILEITSIDPNYIAVFSMSTYGSSVYRFNTEGDLYEVMDDLRASSNMDSSIIKQLEYSGKKLTRMNCTIDNTSAEDFHSFSIQNRLNSSAPFQHEDYFNRFILEYSINDMLFTLLSSNEVFSGYIRDNHDSTLHPVNYDFDNEERISAIEAEIDSIDYRFEFVYQ